MDKLIFPDIHISVQEFSCPCCNKLPPDIYNDQQYYDFFCRWEDIRAEWGKPIKISRGGGWRCPRYQYYLVMNGKTKAVLSPHFAWALDNDLNSTDDVHRFVNIVDDLFPHFRMGFDEYLNRGMTFVHIDQVYLIKPKMSETFIEGYRW